MKKMDLKKAFTLLEPGPVVLITTNDGFTSNIMTISWSMVIDFTPKFAITTGDWNYSFGALQKFKECVISIPTADQIDQIVGIGTCTGRDTDKFEKFGLTPEKAKNVNAPLIKESLANIECKVIDIIKKHDIVILEGITAYFNSSKKNRLGNCLQYFERNYGGGHVITKKNILNWNFIAVNCNGMFTWK